MPDSSHHAPDAPPVRKLAKYLAHLGYGTRREAELMLQKGRITDADGRRYVDGDIADHRDIRLDGEPLDPPPGTVVALNKPVGYVTSLRDANPTVYALLPPRFARRTPVMAPVGRLDKETSGLLLFTDDGALNHRLTSPRSHVDKVYRATLAMPIDVDARELFASGTLRLDADDTPLLPAVLDPVDATHVGLTVREGRYHQVRRMFAATGNHVVELHRERVGPIDLEGIAAGDWRVLSAEERSALARAAGAQR